MGVWDSCGWRAYLVCVWGIPLSRWWTIKRDNAYALSSVPWVWKFSKNVRDGRRTCHHFASTGIETSCRCNVFTGTMSDEECGCSKRCHIWTTKASTGTRFHRQRFWIINRYPIPCMMCPKRFQGWYRTLSSHNFIFNLLKVAVCNSFSRSAHVCVCVLFSLSLMFLFL